MTVAVVSNPLITSQMVPLTKSVFEKQYPGIKVKFATYTEGDLRAAIEKDVSTHSNAFNVIMIGPTRRRCSRRTAGWTTCPRSSSRRTRATTPATCCRRSPRRCPTRAACTRCRSTASRRWSTTARTCSPRPGSPCRRTRPGRRCRASRPSSTSPARWPGSACAAWPAGATTWPRSTPWSTPSAASGSTTKWQPQLTSPAFENATNFYVNLVRKYGEPGASNDSFNQLLTLYGQGKCAMWYDATVAATSIATTYPSDRQADRVRLRADGPDRVLRVAVDLVAGHPAGHHQPGRRLEVRVLGHLEAVRLSWSRTKYGWAAVPPGTRTSLYSNPQYKKAAKAFAPHHPGLDRRDRPGLTRPLNPVPVRRRPVRGHPAVREPRHAGRPSRSRGRSPARRA